MKKRLVTYLLVSALAAAVFAGCSKKDAGDAADAAATDAAVVEEAAEAATASLEDVAAAAEAADAEEAGNVADTTVAAEVADAEVEAAADDASVTEFVDEEVKEDADKKEAEEAEEAEVLVVEPGTTYTVRFGGNIYSSPEEIASNVMYYANPGDYLTIVERLEDYWYKVSYYLAGEGIEHIGYIQIQ